MIDVKKILSGKQTLINNWSRRHALDHRYKKTKQRFDGINTALVSEGVNRSRYEWIEHFLGVAAPSSDGSVKVLGQRMPALFEAERQLILCLPPEMAVDLIADLRTDIANMVLDARRATLSDQVKEAAELLEQSDNKWRSQLFSVKTEVDQIIMRGYIHRERQRDSIFVLGCILLLVVVVTFLTFIISWLTKYGIPFALPTAPVPTESLGAPAALVIGFLAGAAGACLSALFNVTVRGMSRGEFETAGITLIRPLIGGVTGMLAVLFLATGIIDFGQQPVAAAAIAGVVFGFSEQLVLRSVEGLGTRFGASEAGAATSPSGTDNPAPSTGPAK